MAVQSMAASTLLTAAPMGGQSPHRDAQRQRSAEAVTMRWLSSYMEAWELGK